MDHFDIFDIDISYNKLCFLDILQKNKNSI